MSKHNKPFKKKSHRDNQSYQYDEQQNGGDFHKEDTSPKIHQGEKLKEKLFIKELNWNPKQKEFIDKALAKAI